MYFGTFLNIRGDSYQMHIIYAYIQMDTIQSTVPEYGKYRNSM